MLISKESQETRSTILDFEKRIEEMHLSFQKYCQGVESRMPDYERLESDLIFFSRRKIFDRCTSITGNSAADKASRMPTEV